MKLFRPICLGLIFPSLPFVAATVSAQAIQVRDAGQFSASGPIQVESTLPQAYLAEIPDGEVSLLPGLFHERREAAKKYLLSLSSQDILQNYLLEAGVRLDTPYDQMAQGWEAPSCQLRGAFGGHWLSAVARIAAIEHDPLFAARAAEVVDGLKRCQFLNGGEWVGSIPEKYFAILEDGREGIWSPQYTLHKTMMGLFDDYTYLHDPDALAVEERSADWFLAWTARLLREGKGEVIYDGESGGMLELWANLYGATRNPRYLLLASRYAMPDMFRQLLAGGDPLTNNHSNASIPWFQGAARLYEVTGDPQYRKIVELFWKDAVDQRGMFATTGNNAGEFWIPPGQFGRFLGARTQEHCTVYNMIRVAQYLLRWTGDARYADYIERALYNGVLAQQNPHTGMVSYFLPLEPGAKKSWSTEMSDFWCCLGTSVQAQAMYESLIYYRAPDGITVSQFIPSEASLGEDGNRIHLRQEIDDAADEANFSAPGETTQVAIDLTIASDSAAPWTLRIRQPAWALAAGAVTVDGTPAPATVSDRGYLEIRRSWKSAHVRVTFSKRLRREPLPGDSRRFALVDGPVVLAALTATEPELSAHAAIVPQYEHEYIEGRNWRRGHYWVSAAGGTVAVEPLYDIVDETYSVYFASAP